MNVDQLYTVVLLEDSEPDAFLLRRQLSRIIPNLDLKVATSQESFQALIQSVSPHLIISDYRLPHYSGIEALLYARVHAPVVPFVFVTGALNDEELAADTILKGASGFVLKNNMAKLDEIVPGLLQFSGASLDRPNMNITPPTKEGQTKPSISAVVSKLTNADEETLAEIQRLLEKK